MTSAISSPSRHDTAPIRQYGTKPVSDQMPSA